ncbi:hypothetical protein Taro_054306 [Colocasia esculenta]|uniref:Uncharacterized protein n=1 Tax=Colocasia esculenta TaxID=4460 RepID=A0A843XNH3_COLES|nr:hypothetical protein [Colocasia esculenta]
MAKGGGIGRLGKLKCMIKRWHAAAGNYHGPNHRRAAGTPAHDARAVAAAAAVAPDDKVPFGLHPVYVGKSRRRYLVSSHLVDHPLFRVLVQRSGGGAAEEEEEEGGGRPATVVGCEVVLFEHLLWMLENADPQSESLSLDELVEFYAC